MNSAHFHITINHMPFFMTITGIILLGYGIFTKSSTTNKFAYMFFIMSAFGALATYLSGEPAEEIVENIQGISHDLIHEHEEAAKYALIGYIMLFVLSCLGFFLSKTKSSFETKFNYILIVFSIVSCIIIYRVSSLGGKIHHTEISSDPSTKQTIIEED